MILEVQRYTDPIVKITSGYPENQNYHVLSSEREIRNDPGRLLLAKLLIHRNFMCQLKERLYKIGGFSGLCPK